MENISIQIGNKFKLLEDIICFNVDDILSNGVNEKAFDGNMNMMASPTDIAQILINLSYTDEETKNIEWFKKDSIIEIKYFESEDGENISYLEFYLDNSKPNFYAWNFIRFDLLEKII